LASNSIRTSLEEICTETRKGGWKIATATREGELGGKLILGEKEEGNLPTPFSTLKGIKIIYETVVKNKKPAPQTI